MKNPAVERDGRYKELGKRIKDIKKVKKGKDPSKS